MATVYALILSSGRDIVSLGEKFLFLAEATDDYPSRRDRANIVSVHAEKMWRELPGPSECQIPREGVEKSVCTCEMPNSKACTSLFATNSEEREETPNYSDSGEEVRGPTTRRDGESGDVDSHEELGGDLWPAVAPIYCPVCSQELKADMSNDRINDHIDKCLRQF